MLEVLNCKEGESCLLTWRHLYVLHSSQHKLVWRQRIDLGDYHYSRFLHAHCCCLGQPLTLQMFWMVPLRICNPWPWFLRPFEVKDQQHLEFQSWESLFRLQKAYPSALPSVDVSHFLLSLNNIEDFLIAVPWCTMRELRRGMWLATVVHILILHIYIISMKIWPYCSCSLSLTEV